MGVLKRNADAFFWAAARRARWKPGPGGRRAIARSRRDLACQEAASVVPARGSSPPPSRRPRTTSVLDALYRPKPRTGAPALRVVGQGPRRHLRRPRQRSASRESSDFSHACFQRRRGSPRAGLRGRQQPRPHLRPSHQGRAQERPARLPRRAAGRRRPAARPRGIWAAARGRRRRGVVRWWYHRGRTTAEGLLGEAQFRWLEGHLRASAAWARATVVVSPVQVLATKERPLPAEGFFEFPDDRARPRLLANRSALIVSGDVHYAEALGVRVRRRPHRAGDDDVGPLARVGLAAARALRRAAHPPAKHFAMAVHQRVLQGRVWRRVEIIAIEQTQSRGRRRVDDGPPEI